MVPPDTYWKTISPVGKTTRSNAVSPDAGVNSALGVVGESVGWKSCTENRPPLENQAAIAPEAMVPKWLLGAAPLTVICCRVNIGTAVVVPCVGFTAAGHRLGYGGGHYDRWLAAHPHVVAVGVAWSAGEINERRGQLSGGLAELAKGGKFSGEGFARRRVENRPQLQGEFERLAVVCAAGFFASTLFFWPNRWPLYLSLPVLVFVCAYSYTKRFTFLVHFWLGASLLLAPVGAWIAIRGFDQIEIALVLGLAVLFWVAGFDIPLLVYLAGLQASRQGGGRSACVAGTL